MRLGRLLDRLVSESEAERALAQREIADADDEVRLRAARGVEVYTALDGQETFALSDGDGATVTGSPLRLKLVTARGRDYFEVLRALLFLCTV